MYSDNQVARVCHEANRALQYVHGDPVPSLPWDCEPEEIRASVIEGVRRIRRGLTPRENHEEWRKLKVEQGWTWGPEKDPERRTHPCLVPYSDLTPEQRDKDQLFLMIVTALTVNTGTPPGGFRALGASRPYQEHERNHG